MNEPLGEISPYNNMLKHGAIEPRKYQIDIAKSIFSGKNTLVVLPTGLGKTIIAIFAIARSLYMGKKALVLAPTKPLSEQHFDSITRFLNVSDDKVLLLTGATKGSKRAELEDEALVLAATPQTVANDLSKGRLSLKGFGIVVFDECHKAVGKYAYTYVANECKVNGVQILGMTASPGSNVKKVNKLIDTLGIENIEIRGSSDSDVQPYVMDKSTETIYVSKDNNINAIAAMLKPVIDLHLGKLYSVGLSPFKKFENMSKKQLLLIGANINKLDARNYKFGALFNYVYLLHLMHAYDLITTEGMYPFVSYFEALQEKEKKSRSVENILKNPAVVGSLKAARDAISKNKEHPKVEKTVELLKGQLKGKSVIIFVQYRSTIRGIAKVLDSKGIDARTFMGKKEGVTQSQQSETIKDFRDGKFMVLVASSIGEEGLDIPGVDAVIFYEPIPSEIRNIQRKGRAGRFKFGEVIILVTRDTKDEAYLMISRIREKRMVELVKIINEKLHKGIYSYAGKSAKGQTRLK